MPHTMRSAIKSLARGREVNACIKSKPHQVNFEAHRDRRLWWSVYISFAQAVAIFPSEDVRGKSRRRGDNAGRRSSDLPPLCGWGGGGRLKNWTCGKEWREGFLFPFFSTLETYIAVYWRSLSAILITLSV